MTIAEWVLSLWAMGHDSAEIAFRTGVDEIEVLRTIHRDQDARYRARQIAGRSA